MGVGGPCTLQIPPNLPERPLKTWTAVPPPLCDSVGTFVSDHALTSAVPPSGPTVALAWDLTLGLGQVSRNRAIFRLHLDNLGRKVGGARGL